RPPLVAPGHVRSGSPGPGSIVWRTPSGAADVPSCRLPRTVLLATLLIPTVARGQAPPAEWQPWLDSLAHAPRAERIEQDVRTLVGFGTRHTASDTVSTTRGIGAARRWIHAEFERIS